MKRVIYIVILLAVAAGLYVYAYPRLSGVTTADAQQSASTGSAPAAPAAPAPGRASTAVTTAVAAQQNVPISKSEVGYIQPANTVVVRARATGEVTADPVQEGQIVKVGDVLFKLDDSAIQADLAKDQAQIAKDQANEASSEVTLQREQDLVKKGVDPQSTLDADVAAEKAAQATIAVDQAQLKSDQVAESYMTITAPMAGRVGTVNTSIGNIVQSTDTSAGGLMTITQMSPLRVSFSIAEADLDRYRAAIAKQPKGVPVQIFAPGDKQPRAVGNLSFIDSSVDTGSGTIVLNGDVDNTNGNLWPGQYVTAVTQLGSYDNATTIPLQAVQESNTGPFVFKIVDSKAQQTPVSVTDSVGTVAVIGNGVKPGDHVVTEGQLQLNNGSAVTETASTSKTSVNEDDTSLALSAADVVAAPGGSAPTDSSTPAAQPSAPSGNS